MYYNIPYSLLRPCMFALTEEPRCDGQTGVELLTAVLMALLILIRGLSSKKTLCGEGVNGLTMR